MHIDYRGLLPASKTCDHGSVSWETVTADEIPAGKGVTAVEVPQGTPGAKSIKVKVACQQCPSNTTKTIYYVWSQ